MAVDSRFDLFSFYAKKQISTPDEILTSFLGGWGVGGGLCEFLEMSSSNLIVWIYCGSLFCIYYIYNCKFCIIWHLIVTRPRFRAAAAARNRGDLAVMAWYFDGLPVTRDTVQYVRLRTKARTGSHKHHQLCGYLTWRCLEWFPWVDAEQPAGDVSVDWLRARHGARIDPNTGLYIEERPLGEHLDETEHLYECKFKTVFSLFLAVGFALTIAEKRL